MSVDYTNWTNLDSRYSREYQEGDRLVRGWHGKIDPVLTDGKIDLHATAEQVWRRHNADDRPDGQLCPSMSIGDVIQFGNRDGCISLSVARTGFGDVLLDPSDLITDRSWSDMVSS